ncbi:MAG TPA: DUF349 domain-containing protein [Candidatus Limnocylindrales bacterium]|nr:DUF349 domain-containing protein [Candidatus Limnocylindrales bacterium]
MGIFDRLKPQPRWKHPDAAVRRTAIADLDDAVELATLAEHDPDAEVRAAAVAKVADPVVLGRVGASDADAGVRDAAAERLLALALDAANPEAATAAGLLPDLRRVSVIAKSAAADDVRAVALARLTDERSLGGVARQARVESTALAAAARLTSPEELLATALNSEHREVALAAFDRVVQAGPAGADVALLETIEARAKHKSVARRARTMRQAIEDEENARRAAEEQRRSQEASLCAAVERLRDVADPDGIAAELARLDAAWDALASTDEAATQRFRAGVDAARLRMTQRRSEIAAAAEEARRRREALASREELCRRIETIERHDGGGTDGASAGEAESTATVETVRERLRSIEEEWAGLAPLPGYERDVEGLTARFEAAAQACRKRLEREAALQDARSALEALVSEAESLPTRDGKAAADRWRTLAREAQVLAAMLNDASRPSSDLMDRLAEVGRTLAARETEAREAAAKAARDHAARLAQLVARARKAAEADTITLREGERLLRDMATALDNAGRTERTTDIADALAVLRTLQDPLARRVKELRDLDEWRRFANAQRQEELIAMAEAIVAALKAEEEAGAASDLPATAKALRELQSQWQKVADVPQQSAQQLWSRFKAAADFIRSRCEVHFAELRQQRSASLAAKAELVAQAEALAESTDWSKTAARLRELQKAWEETGPVPGDQARDLTKRFRAACNTFFTRRRDDLTAKKAEWAENLARKEALCEQAEQLAESTDWDAAAAALKKLQAEWKGIGPVQHAKSEAVWKRFRAAADRFFERYHKRHELAAAAQLAEREAIVVAMEALAALETVPDDLAGQVQALRTTMANAPHVEGAGMQALRDRWTAALATLVSRSPAAFAGTDLDPVANRQRMERLIAKVESLLGEDAPVAATGKTATEVLAERLRAALERNALGARPDATKWRAAARAVEEAQEAWRRLMRLPGAETDALEKRFEAACARVMDQVKPHVRSADAAEGGFGERGSDRRSGRPKRSGGRR